VSRRVWHLRWIHRCIWLRSLLLVVLLLGSHRGSESDPVAAYVSRRPTSGRAPRTGPSIESSAVAADRALWSTAARRAVPGACPRHGAGASRARFLSRCRGLCGAANRTSARASTPPRGCRSPGRGPLARDPGPVSRASAPNPTRPFNRLMPRLPSRSTSPGTPRVSCGCRRRALGHRACGGPEARVPRVEMAF